jgi:toxin ParE1/3/4
LKRRIVTFTPEARSDLIDLADWIAERAGVDVALNYVERLEAYCADFEIASARGQRRDDIRPGLRVVGFERRVAIAFTVSATKVTVLRLYYGGRNWAGIPSG